MVHPTAAELWSIVIKIKSPPVEVLTMCITDFPDRLLILENKDLLYFGFQNLGNIICKF